MNGHGQVPQRFADAGFAGKMGLTSCSMWLYGRHETVWRGLTQFSQQSRRCHRTFDDSENRSKSQNDHISRTFAT